MDYNKWMQYIANILLKYRARRDGKLRFVDGTPTDHLCLCESKYCGYCDCYAMVEYDGVWIQWTKEEA